MGRTEISHALELVVHRGTGDMLSQQLPQIGPQAPVTRGRTTNQLSVHVVWEVPDQDTRPRIVESPAVSR